MAKDNWVRKAIQVENSKRAEFWMSHLLVILGTVLGVYLAASIGFDKAIEYELVKSDKDSYYLRSAMQQELEDNLDNIDLWATDFLSGNARNYIGKPEQYQLEDFVWKTMQESAGTFEIPNNILTGIRRYYAHSRSNLEKMTRKNYAAHDDVNAMQVESENVRSELLPLIENDIEKLKLKVEKYGIKL